MSWDVITIIIIFTFSMICYFGLAAFPAFLLLISNFFNLELSFFELKTVWLFYFVVFAILLSQNFKNFQCVIRDRSAHFFITLVCLVLIIPVAHHYILWKVFPRIYFVDTVKSMWMILFLLVPYEKLNFNKVTIYFFWSFTISIFLIAPESILYYLDKGTSFGRSVPVWYIGNQITNYGLKFDYKFVPDDNVINNLGIMTYALFLPFFKLSEERRKFLIQIFLYSSLLVFSLFVLYVNQYLSSLLSFVIVVLNLFFIASLKMFSRKNFHLNNFIKSPVLFIFLAVFIIISGTFLANYFGLFDGLIETFGSRFKFNLDPNHIDSQTRLSLFLRGLIQFKDHIFLGGSYIKSYQFDETYSGLITLTRHSTLIDNFIAFGVFVGLIANFIYLLPIYYLKRVYTKDFKTAFIWSSFYLLLLFQTTESTFGRYSTHRGIFYIFVWLLIKNFSKDKKEQLYE